MSARSGDRTSPSSLSRERAGILPSCLRVSRGFEDHASEPVNDRRDAARRDGRGRREAAGVVGAMRRDVMGHAPLRARGLSLVELIMFIVIVGAAVAGIIAVISRTTQSSADPLIRKQALAIAEAMLEEVRLQPFTYCDPDDPTAATASSSGGGATITFDANNQATTGETAVGSLTFSHPVGSSGTNRILVVGVNIFDTNSPIRSVSTMTYAGQNMTFLAAAINPTTTRIRTEMWYITAPATGTNNIVITFSGNVRAVAGSVSYTGVSQAAPFGTAVPAGADSGTTLTVDVSSAAGEIVLDSAGIRQTTGAPFETLTAGAGQTERYNLTSGTSSNSNLVGAGSQEAGAPTVTMSWTASSSRPWAMVAAPLKPAAGGCPTLVEAIGPETGETRYSTVSPFDNVNDYHGFDSNSAVPSGIRTIDGTLIPGLDGYRATVSVVSQPLGGIGNDANGFPQSLLVTVTVTGPGNTTVAVSGYRTRYAPNVLP